VWKNLLRRLLRHLAADLAAFVLFGVDVDVHLARGQVGSLRVGQRRRAFERALRRRTLEDRNSHAAVLAGFAGVEVRGSRRTGQTGIGAFPGQLLAGAVIGDVDGAGLPTLVAPAELWIGSGVGAGEGSEVELAVGGGTGGGALECPPGIGVFVTDGVGVQLQVSSGEDGGSLGVGGDEVSDSVDVGCSLGVGSPLSDAVGVGDGSLVEGAGSELEGGRVG